MRYRVRLHRVRNQHGEHRCYMVEMWKVEGRWVPCIGGYKTAREAHKDFRYWYWR